MISTILAIIIAAAALVLGVAGGYFIFLKVVK